MATYTACRLFSVPHSLQVSFCLRVFCTSLQPFSKGQFLLPTYWLVNQHAISCPPNCPCIMAVIISPCLAIYLRNPCVLVVLHP